jgi:hypothetical protein
MSFRPNFTGFAETKGDELVILGESPPPFPDHLHVYLEQDGHVAEGTVREPSTAWQVVFSAAGFGSGPASAFGVEVRTEPFGASSWTETVQIP